VDADGHVFITGRVKEIFKTLKGKYVAPAPIEGAFGRNSSIDLICVMGSGMKQPIAVLVLSPEAAARPWEDMAAELLQTLEEINRELEAHERVAQLFVCSDEWTPDNGMVTPTLKVRRDKVEDVYLPLVEAGQQQTEIVQRLDPALGE
jgi:long-chain acyl-CoA synthetase